MFFEGGGVGVLDEEVEEIRGCLSKIFFDILLEIDDEH